MGSKQASAFLLGISLFVILGSYLFYGNPETIDNRS